MLNANRGFLSLQISMTLTLIVFLTYLFSVVSLYVGLGVNNFIFPFSFLAGTAIGLLIPIRRDNIFFKNGRPLLLFTVFCITAVSLRVGETLYDYSYDGLRYHQNTIAALLNGWNPLNMESDPNAPSYLWSLHYAAGIEICEAAISSFAGRIEAGKGLNLIAVFAALTAVYGVLRNCGREIFFRDSKHSFGRKQLRVAEEEREEREERDEREEVKEKIEDGREKIEEAGFGWKKALLLSVAIVGNPVVTLQLFIYYIDFYKYLYLLLFLVGIVLLSSSRERISMFGCMMTGMTLILAMASKFNFFFEAGVWVLLALVWCIIRKKWLCFRRLLTVSVISLVIGLFLTIHPYYINLIDYGHPFYPLMGEGAVDIMNYNTPEIYDGHNRIVNFFYSLIKLSIPNYDQREGGFTILMPFILLLSLFIIIRNRKSIRPVIIYLYVWIILSCFFFEQSWWARYITQLWLAGGIGAIIGIAAEKRRTAGCILSWIMIAVTLSTGALSLGGSIRKGGYIKSMLNTCSYQPVTLSGTVFPQVKRHLDENGIYYRMVSSPDSVEGVAYSYYSGYPPVIILSARQAERLRENKGLLGDSRERY
ncbi:MAG: hypothetical protein K2H18_00770 [Muribaculaceae bacterium]|nr:hypothetical protein [Muribaculaceae bacterium]